MSTACSTECDSLHCAVLRRCAAGNDLARCLGWGGGHGAWQQEGVGAMLAEVQQAALSHIDRWDVGFAPPPPPPAPPPSTPKAALASLTNLARRGWGAAEAADIAGGNPPWGCAMRRPTTMPMMAEMGAGVRRTSTVTVSTRRPNTRRTRSSLPGAPGVRAAKSADRDGLPSAFASR